MSYLHRSVHIILQGLISDLTKKHDDYLLSAECSDHKSYKFYLDNCKAVIANLTMLTALQQTIDFAESADLEDRNSNHIQKMIEQANQLMKQVVDEEDSDLELV